MKVFSIYFLFAMLAMSVQSTLFKGTKPDFMLILVCFYSFRYGQIKGLSYGALTGLFIDLVNGFIIGPNLMSKAVIGYLIPSVRKRMFQWNVVINTVMIVIVSIIDIFLVYVCLESFADMDFINRSLKISIMQIVYTTIFSLILYPMFSQSKNDSVYLQMRSRT